jgi:hypothetical protein
MNTTTNRLLTVAAGVALAAAALTGCTSTSAPTTDSTSQAGTDEQDRMRWESDLAACLAGQGFDLPDEPGQIDFGSRQGEYDLASAQCQDEVGPMPGAVTNISPEQEAAEAESWAAEDKCFRDAGFSEGAGDQSAPSMPSGASDELIDTCLAAGEDAREKALAR